MGYKKRVDLPLSEDDLKKLDLCKRHFQRVAYTDTIRDTITAYLESLKIIQDLREKLNAEKEENKKMNLIIGNLKAAFRNLLEF